MERSRLAVHAHTAPVVKPICGVARLLHLIDARACTDGVDKPAGYEKDVAWPRGMFHHELLELARMNGVLDIGSRGARP